ncbi:DNA polymerase/3'-5' exonuclease PolX [Syntrophaceticus schinkii]|jgi:DNA polymerase (family 10)|uniref:DNA polymerase beta n=1 Tax=Syntrophaceticus schinkii TaxID=499207 RepID=A0A0B7MMY3_9FIRM|nr:DNA polymerase/3'-5' exonuclease PolX [Syntrophaceticus schinkii]CEO89593.1 DNA polymerase/3'-5' exonuclease PolX (Includes: DNA polymerase type-X; 3'-5' exodeoxyribonuclease) [Syntrophaceticus schinkii]
MNNWEIAKLFDEIADLLDILGENPYKARAYRRAAHKLGNAYLDVEELADEGRLQEIPGIGSALEKKIEEYAKTGELKYLTQLRKKAPTSLRQLLLIPGIGVKTIQIIYQQLGITNLQDLEAAARKRLLQELPGIGVKTEQAIISGLEAHVLRRRRLLLHHAFAFAGEIESHLKDTLPGLANLQIAGSLRRGKESVGDLDFVAAADNPAPVVDAFKTVPFVNEVVAAGEVKATIMTKWGFQADLLVVQPEFFASALQHLTGSKEHNIILRGIAREQGLKISEYGIHCDGQVAAPVTEEELYRRLGMDYIPPELREGRGEIEAAQNGVLPELLNVDHIKGDLHVHSEWSDGINTLEELAQSAQERGYRYLAVTDHSRSLRIARGLTEERVREQQEEIRRLNRGFTDFRLLAGIEVEILPDGSLDFEDELLAEMDIVIASVHSGFKQDRKTITRRVLSALQNEHVDIIGHPTGRLLGRRDPYDIDVDALLQVAAETGTALEINASPDRLDLHDEYVHQGIEIGVRFAVNTDAHDVYYLDDIQYGVLQARRGWAERSDIINALPLSELFDWLYRR